MSVDETLRKEAWEEAGLAPTLLGDLNCVSAVRVEYSVPEGLHREILFVHDLWLSPEFTPCNQDGEVSEIRCMPVEDVIQNLLTADFTLDAGVVMIDGLLRLGAVLPEDPQLPRPATAHEAVTALALGLILLAALVHASWNFLLKKSGGGAGLITAATGLVRWSCMRPSRSGRAAAPELCASSRSTSRSCSRAA